MYLQGRGIAYSASHHEVAATAAAAQATGVAGSVARSMYAMIVKRAQEIEDKDFLIKRYLDMRFSDYVVSKIEERLVPESEARFVVNEFCTTCNKHATGTHLGSERHKKLIRTQAAISYFCGMPLRPRQLFCGAFPSVAGGLITQRDLREWWGDELESFPNVAKSLVAQNVCRVVHLNDPRSSTTIPSSERTPGTLYVIPYVAMSGMYSRHSKDCEAIRFCDVPPGASPAGMPGSSSRTMEEEHMELLSVAAAQQKQRGMGWWPVVRWHATETASVINRATLDNSIYVSCIYQWFDSLDSDGIIAWKLLREADYQEGL